MAFINNVLILIGLFLFFKFLKELFYIRLYVFIIRLKAEGKLIPENDPNGAEKVAWKELKKNSTKLI